MPRLGMLSPGSWLPALESSPLPCLQPWSPAFTERAAPAETLSHLPEVSGEGQREVPFPSFLLFYQDVFPSHPMENPCEATSCLHFGFLPCWCTL